MSSADPNVATVLQHQAGHTSGAHSGQEDIKSQYLGFDHVHLWVGNAMQAAQWYVARFGFQHVAYRGLETGERAVATHVVKCNDVMLAFSSALVPGNKEMGAHQELHGDGVKDVAFRVDDCRATFQACLEGGAKPVMEPKEFSDENGVVVMATIEAYADTVHSFVERKNYKGLFMPGFKDTSAQHDPLQHVTPSPNFVRIDHVVGNHDWDQMLNIEEWYKKTLGFHRFWSVDDKQLHTEFSALRSVVMADPAENVKLPQNEPAEGKRKSQIREYVEYYGSAGVQHVALLTNDIVHTIHQMNERGVNFLKVPDTYYQDLQKRLDAAGVKLDEDMEILKKYKILVDFDENGYLLQLFTQPVEDRPTLFFEVIERHNNQGFGIGNFKALFEAIERHQAERGNL